MKKQEEESGMNISIFGLGYVGCVGAACCAKLGHHVIGNDVSENKVNLINQGKPTIIEAEIDELVKEAHDKGLLEATMDYRYAVHNSEISFIVVGTPSSKEGHLNLNYIYGVPKQIGEALKDKDEFHRRHPQHRAARHQQKGGRNHRRSFRQGARKGFHHRFQS